MSSVSSSTSSYSSLYEKLNSISKVTKTTSKYFSTSISKSNSNLSIIEGFNSSINISDDPFYTILSESSSLKNGTTKTNISSYIANSSSSSTSSSSTSTSEDSSSSASTTTSSIDTLV